MFASAPKNCVKKTTLPMAQYRANNYIDVRLRL